MTTLNFDQLLNAPNLRKLAARTVETYPNEWKVVHETLQNAKDAIRKTGQPGRVDVVLDLANQSVTVKDTGAGFPRDNNLLGFGGTDKDSDPDWCLNGKQGVGLKAVILSTAEFSIEAVNQKKKWSLNIRDADRFIEGGDPEFQIVEHGETDEPSGTTVRYSFRDTLVSDFVRQVLDQQLPYVTEYLAENPNKEIALAIESYFRSYTYAGDVNVLLAVGTPPPVPIEINVELVAATEPTGRLPEKLLKEIQAGRLRCTFKSGHWNLKEAVDRTRSRRSRPTVLTQALPQGGLLGRYNENFVYANTFSTENEYRQLLLNPNLRRPIEQSKYDRLFELLRGIYVAIGSRATLSRYLIGSPRQFIAADGTPTAHILPGPTRGGDASYVTNNIHFVANVDAQLNYGKQTISNTRLVGLVSEYFSDVVRASLRNVAICIVGSSWSSSSGDDVENSPFTETDVISRPKLANGRLNFKRVPRDENALIAIFFELLGRNDLTGYHFYSMSQRATYDGRASMKLNNMPETPSPNFDGDLQNVEFKLALEDLIDDFEHEIKSPNDVSLVVVWDDAIRANITDYQVLDIEHTNDAERRMDGVEKVLQCKRQNRTIQMLVVQEFLQNSVVGLGNGP